jgi:nicotinamide riboside transporter PnuC
VYIRYVQLYSLFFAPGLLWLTLAFRAPGKADPLDRWLVLTLVVSIVVTNLIEYGGPLATSMSLAILHHRPFSECFVMVFLLAGYARNLRRSRQWGLLAAMAVFFVIVWVPRSDINGDVYPLNWLYLGTGIFILLGSAAFLLRQKRFTSSFNEADAR